jgi:hypothetical protein
MKSILIKEIMKNIKANALCPAKCSFITVKK